MDVTYFENPGMARDHYRSFAYVTGTYPLKSKYVLKISVDIIKDRRLRNEPIMEYYFTHNLLCQFYWIDDTIAHLYFSSENQLQHASNWWKSKDMLIEKLGKDIKNDKLPHEGNHTSIQNKTGHSIPSTSKKRRQIHR
ncbi:hypothetical protein RhiirA5_348404 [Rhizophagus irregularis]|nr:hypothetical protein RhiirA5_348404 [Rhizophagus irregularis]PKC74472.1 hypothetical protein RhiirA1_409137 [Rhizophagus irregularis]